MATYTITAPNGQSYTIDGPEGATDEQVQAEVLRQHPDAATPSTDGTIDPETGALNVDVVGGNDGSIAPPMQELPAGNPDYVNQLLGGTQNAVAGIGQGLAAIPDAATKALGAVMGEGAEYLGDKIGAGVYDLIDEDAGLAIRDAGRDLKKSWLDPVTIGGMIEAGAPTPKDDAGWWGRFAAQLAGGLVNVPGLTTLPAKMMAKPPAAASKAVANVAEDTAPTRQAAADIARRLEVESTPGTVGGPTARAAQMALGNLPGSAELVGNAATREVETLGDAASRAASKIGTPKTPQQAGEDIVKGVSAYRRFTSTEGGKLYRLRDQLVGGSDAPVAMQEARGAFDDFSKNYPTSPALEKLNEHPSIRKLAGAIPADVPMTLSEATEALSHIRGVKRNLATKSDATPVVLERVRKLEQAIEDDVMNAARNADRVAGREGAGSAVQAQMDADRYWAERSRALSGSLKMADRSANDGVEVAAEKVYEQVAKDALRKGGNLTRLRDTWARLPQGARRSFAATKIDDMGRATNGNQDELGQVWSSETFLTNYNAMDATARRLIFGEGADKELADVAAYAARLRAVQKTRNFSNTTRNTVAAGIASVLGTLLFKGDVASAGQIAAATAAAWPTAKLFLATPAMRSWTKSALSLASTGPKAADKAPALLSRLAAIGSANPEISNDVFALHARLTDAFAQSPAKLAAAPAPTGSEVEQ